MVGATIYGFSSRLAFTAVVGLVAVQRLWELRRSARNLRTLRARGAVEVGAEHYPWMVALHTAFLASSVVEVWLLQRPWIPWVAAVSAATLTAAEALRWWTLRTLGERWTTRVLVVPGESPVTSGPYRFLRHPNYVAVVLEIFAIPMLHCAWITAIVFSTANLGLLRQRIAVEEEALENYAGSHEDLPSGRRQRNSR